MTVDIKSITNTVTSDGTPDDPIETFAPADGELWYFDEASGTVTNEVGGSPGNFTVYARVQRASGKTVWDKSLAVDDLDANHPTGDQQSAGLYLYPGDKIEIYEKYDSSDTQSEIAYDAKLRRIL